MAKNCVARLRVRRLGPRAITAVRAPLEDPADRVAYSRNAFDAFLEHAGLNRASIQDQRVLELGPGPDLCLALRFLAAGAENVSCIDRFNFDAAGGWQRDVYRSLLDDLDDGGRSRLSNLLSVDGDLRPDGARLKVIRGVGIEGGAATLQAGGFDLIVSVAVLEHVYDLGASFRSMDALLAPGGLMIHQVDLRDHGMFSNGGRHPLEFLTVGDRLYRLMTSHTGAPNRERIDTYRRLLDDLGHEAEVSITNVGGARQDLAPYRDRLVAGRDVEPAMLASVERLRARLPTRFAEMPSEDLAATGILVRSRKPAAKRPAG